MTPLLPRTATRRRLAAVLASARTMALATTAPAQAGPGAHGPDGEHLDTPTAARSASALPRVEAHSETFELVAELRAGGLVVLVDRYASNEPVLGATLEIGSGALKAVAAFRAEQGDYVVTDGAMLAALAQPGEHGLVFTLVAGSESDLLDGTLVTPRAGAGTGDHGHDDHDHAWERAALAGGGLAALALLGGIALRRRRGAAPLQGAR